MSSFKKKAVTPVTVTVVLLLSWLFSPKAMAQPDQSRNSATNFSRPLSLSETKRLATANNWDLLAAAAGVDIAIAQKIVAREFPNPSFSVSTTSIRVDGQSNSGPDGNGFWDRSYDTIIAVNQLFEIGGKRRNRKVSAQANLEGARAQFLDAKRTLDLAVTKAYVAAAQSEETVRVLLKSAETLDEEAKLAELRFKAGEISSSDKSQIEITSRRFKLDAETARANAAQARIGLEVLIGLSRPRGEITLADHLDDLCAEPPPIVSAPQGFRRPDIVAAEAALRKADADIRLQKANRIPDPTILAQYEHQPPDKFNTMGIGVSFPLPLWNRNRGNILAAEAAREQARFALEKIQAQAVADVLTSKLAYQDSIKKWRTYRDEIRPKSEGVRQALAYAYAKGGTSLLDMLVAERNDNDIRLAATQAAGDAAAALAALRAATTEISPGETNK